MSEELDIQEFLNQKLSEIGQRIVEIYRQQVPSPSKGSPFATGRLRGSIEYRVLQNNQISIYFNRYGVFTDLGTGPYFQTATTDPFGLPPARDYQQGFGGCQAQYWTSLAGHEEIIEQLEEELANHVELMIATTTQRRVQID